MAEQLFFILPDVQELHKQVEKELGRVEGEDWEDFQEIVRYEVNNRLKEANRYRPKPNYASPCCNQSDKSSQKYHLR